MRGGGSRALFGLELVYKEHSHSQKTAPVAVLVMCTSDVWLQLRLAAAQDTAHQFRRNPHSQLRGLALGSGWGAEGADNPCPQPRRQPEGLPSHREFH